MNTTTRDMFLRCFDLPGNNPSKRRHVSVDGVGIGQWVRLCTRRREGWRCVIPGYDVYCEEDGTGWDAYFGVGSEEVVGMKFCDVVEVVNSVWKWGKLFGEDIDFSGVGYVVREWLGGRLGYERMCGYVVEWSGEYGMVEEYGGALRVSDADFYGELEDENDRASWEAAYKLHYCV